MSDQKKITYIITHADDDPESATIPFILASAAMTMDVNPVIILQSKGVMLAVKGFAEHVHFEEGTPLKDLMDAYIEAGNRLLLCSPCLEKRKITKEHLIEGTEIVGAARVTEEVLSSVNVLNY
ncbi:MAG: DsrE family protein [Spirochaetes bacterium]|nr:DsrE family protein [Spirochaetota bacterium]